MKRPHWSAPRSQAPLAPRGPAAAARAPATASILDLTEDNFASLVNGHPFAIVNVHAPSHPASGAFAPIFAAASERHPDVLFLKVDAERQRALVAQLNIQALPTLLIFRDNIVVFAKPGVPGAADLEAVLRAARGLDMAEVRRQVAAVEAVAVGSSASPAVTGEATPSPRTSPSIEDFLHPSLRGSQSSLADIAARLAAGRMVAIPGAFEPEFAERMHRCLDRFEGWRVHENYADRFSYQHHNIYHPEEFPEDLAWCAKVFDAPASKAWAERLSGRRCPGPTSISASWYQAGDHSLPHSDNVTTGAHYVRQLAFVWHLSKDWRPEWGGALYWCPAAAYQPSAFNTLYLFNVSPDSTHFVTSVSPSAQGKRLTINGWWTGSESTGNSRWPGPERLAEDDAEILVY